MERCGLCLAVGQPIGLLKKSVKIVVVLRGYWLVFWWGSGGRGRAGGRESKCAECSIPPPDRSVGYRARLAFTEWCSFSFSACERFQ